MAPNAEHVSVDNFMNSPKYEEVVAEVKASHGRAVSRRPDGRDLAGGVRRPVASPEWGDATLRPPSPCSGPSVPG